MPPRPSWSWRAAVSALCTLAVVSPASGQLRPGTAVQGFTQPVAFVQDPSDPAVQYVVEQGGRIKVVQNGTVLADDFLNLAVSITSGGERGLLGLALPADYAATGRVYVNFTDVNGHTVVARFTRSAANRFVADPASRLDSPVVHGRARDSAALRQPQRRKPGVRSGRVLVHRDG